MTQASYFHLLNLKKKHIVVLNGQIPPWSHIEAGVLQESIFGLVFFYLYKRSFQCTHNKRQALS